jgi:hypothetical protein
MASQKEKWLQLIYDQCKKNSLYKDYFIINGPYPKGLIYPSGCPQFNDGIHEVKAGMVEGEHDNYDGGVRVWCWHKDRFSDPNRGKPPPKLEELEAIVKTFLETNNVPKVSFAERMKRCRWMSDPEELHWRGKLMDSRMDYWAGNEHRSWMIRSAWEREWKKWYSD